MVNFVDHKSNYCRVFLARTKDAPAKQFEHFLAFFEKRFDCRIHVLRTDSGGEYQNVDLFGKKTGVARQRSEANNQASNGKAERMHRTIMNMASALEANGVWRVVRKPRKEKLLHTKWVFKTKLDAGGGIERFKARLVACGNEQEFGVNYGLTFAAVIEMSSVKVILALARRWRVPAKHGDVPNAYVKADKEADLDIFIRLPQGMTVPVEVLKMLKAEDSDELALELQ
eukprot:jgi/Phyca11/132500/e_gw1.174.10.1